MRADTLHQDPAQNAGLQAAKVRLDQNQALSRDFMISGSTGIRDLAALASGGECPPLTDRLAKERSMARVRPLIGRQYRLGHDVIDSDHMAIADWWLRTVNCKQIQFAFFIARLKKLMRDHFDREAILMEGAGGRLCQCHRREHQMLLDLCDRATALSRDNRRKAQTLLRRELPRLVREHIVCMDQLTVLFINTHGEIACAG